MKARVCLVEDDVTIREIVALKLQSNGYEVESYGSIDQLTSVSDNHIYDLYILDVLIDGKPDGLKLCYELKSHSPTVSILILSALSEPMHRIEGLRCGADDYLGKPFEMEELLLRVEGMIKRRSWYSSFPSNEAIYNWDGNSINFKSFEARRGFDTYSMSQKECMLMKLLIEKVNQVVTRDEILNKVWGYDVFPSTRTVDNFILRIRKYFEVDPKRPKYIHSIRGMGYKFTARGQA